MLGNPLIILSLLTFFTLNAQVENDIQFTGTFGGNIIDNQTYTNPIGAEAWAGFSNEDLSIYPLNYFNCLGNCREADNFQKWFLYSGKFFRVGEIFSCFIFGSG